ncbi:hybrid sensor histidine kinase/response regulator [Sphaerochaeta sp.]|uniref:hybrid sensor histidine kinase/response regulator n=1 Tax=Sphaerochaeta sp. TaxID=1972642 RepID=UPI002FCB8086
MTTSPTNDSNFLHSFDIGLITIKCNGLKHYSLLSITQQALEYLQLTEGPFQEQTLFNRIHASFLFADIETQAHIKSYTLKIGERYLQVLVYPVDNEKVIKLLLISVGGIPSFLEPAIQTIRSEHDMHFSLDTDYTIIGVESQGRKGRLHVLPEQVVGKTIADFIEPGQIRQWYSAFERALATKGRQTVFYRTSKQFGPRMLKMEIEWNERAGNYHVSVDDLTSGMDLSHREDDLLNTGVLVVDSENRIEYVDEPSLGILEKDREALLGRDIRTLFSAQPSVTQYTVQYHPTLQKQKKIRMSTVPIPRPGNSLHSLIQIVDITREDDPQRKNEFINLLLHFTYQLLQVSFEDVDEVLQDILSRLGIFSDADRVYVFQGTEDGLHMSNTHEWCAPGVVHLKETLQNIPDDLYPHWNEALHLGQEIYIPSVESLPDSWHAERQILIHRKVSSVLVEPIIANGKRFGFVGLDTLQTLLDWSEETRGLLYMFANILGAFFARAKSEQQLKVTLEATELLVKEREEVNRSLQAFYTRIGHDTRNSLNAIHASTELLRSTRLDTMQKRYVDTMESNSLFLLHLMRDIIEFSSFSTRPVSLVSQKISLCEVVRNAVTAVRILAEEKGLLMMMDWDDCIPSSVMGDPVRLAQILVNLLHNAVKFTNSGTIRVSGRLVGLTVAQATVQLSVQDTGKGMDEKTVKNLFPFEGRIPSPSFGEGYGLGLSIVKQLTKAMQGNVTVESDVGKGTTFTCTLEFPISKTSAVVSIPSATENPMHVLLLGESSEQTTAVLELLHNREAVVYRYSDIDAFLLAVRTIGSRPLDLVLLESNFLRNDTVLNILGETLKTIPAYWVCFVCCPIFIQERHAFLRKRFPLHGYLLSGTSAQANYREIQAKRTLTCTSGLSRSTKTEQTTTRMCVLVIDDSVITQELMRQQMASLQTDVLMAGTGSQALDLLQTCDVDLVVTDFSLPDLDGVQITERIRTFTDVKKRNVPVVVVSAYVSEVNRKRCEAVGIRDCLMKPLEREALMSLLARYRED